MSLMKWHDVWRSLDWDSDAEQYREDTLLRRAEKYARPAEDDSQVDVDALRVLVFTRGQEHYAIPVYYILRGVAEPRITPLPCVPPYYRGVVNLRGQILSVLDLRRFWGIGGEAEPPNPRLIVIQAGQNPLAIQADEVLELTHIPIAEIVPPMSAGVGLTHIQGISADGLVIVDVDSLLTDSRLYVHDEL